MRIFSVSLLAMTAGFLVGACSTVPAPETRLPSAAEAHSAWQLVLSSYVDERGAVDFEELKKHPAALERFVNYVARVGPRSKPEAFASAEAALAHNLNVYNALAMYQILQKESPESLAGVKKINFLYL